MYVCTCCRKISKCLHEHEVESACAHEQQLASMQTSDQLHALVIELQADKQALQIKQESLEPEICELREQFATATWVIEEALTRFRQDTSECTNWLINVVVVKIHYQRESMTTQAREYSGTSESDNIHRLGKFAAKKSFFSKEASKEERSSTRI